MGLTLNALPPLTLEKVPAKHPLEVPARQSVAVGEKLNGAPNVAPPVTSALPRKFPAVGFVIWAVPSFSARPFLLQEITEWLGRYSQTPEPTPGSHCRFDKKCSRHENLPLGGVEHYRKTHENDRFLWGRRNMFR